MHRTTVFLPDDLKRMLARLADETGRSEAELIREGITLAVARHTPAAPRSGIFASGDRSSGERTDELLTGFGRQ
jgi:hypothetical protein